VDETQIQEIGIGIFVVFMTITVGLDLTPSRVVKVFRHPSALFRGLLLNYLAIPAVAIGLVHAFDVPPLWAGGILIGTLAPGGPVGPVLAQRAGGHVPLAISLAVVMNLANTVITPAMVWITHAMPVQPDQDLPVFGMIRTIVLFQLVPLALAMAWRHHRPQRAKRHHAIVERLTRVVLGLAVLGMAVLHHERVFQLPWNAGAALLGCVFASIWMGWMVGGRDRAVRTTISLTAGIRSMSVSLILVAAWFPAPETMLATLCYSFIMFTFTWAVAEVMGRRHAAASRTAQ
jgi:BASS family bile acid:Na+ symporter